MVLVLASCGLAVSTMGNQDVKSPTQDQGRISIARCNSCHGSHSFIDPEQPGQLWQSAYPIWASRDPHAQAYLTLWNDQSKRIVAALAGWPIESDSSPRSSLDVELQQSIINERCIGCHSSVPAELSMEMAAQNTGSRTDRHLFMSDGVSCHSCHSEDALDDHDGNTWIERHVQQAWVDGKYNRSSSGLRNLADPHVRARTCASCHVGSENRDVNHDLIAAGHPRLVFEYSSLLARMPKHWDEKPNRNFHVECWSAGQTELANASIELLNLRARESLDGNRPWPEFAEYNCHHCHHGLEGSWYIPNESKWNGKAAWASWAFPAESDRKTWSESISKLRLEMQKPVPDAAFIAGLTAKWPENGPNDHAAADLITFLKRQPKLNSDELFAWYLAVISGMRDAPAHTPQNDVLRQRLAELRQRLAELKKILDAPFSSPDENRNIKSEELNRLIAAIRELIMPMLDHQRDVEEPKP